jgi:NAD(P)-dependent dehydrogenase (short-subunit alcohol dehydrogenase family)
MLQPAGRVILVSGASRGIGRAVADRLVGSGFTVAAGNPCCKDVAHMKIDINSDMGEGFGPYRIGDDARRHGPALHVAPLTNVSTAIGPAVRM